MGGRRSFARLAPYGCTTTYKYYRSVGCQQINRRTVPAIHAEACNINYFKVLWGRGFEHLQGKYDWVLKPVVGYPLVDRLIEVLEDKVVRPAEAKFNELLARRTKQLRVENV